MNETILNVIYITAALILSFIAWRTVKYFQDRIPLTETRKACLEDEIFINMAMEPAVQLSGWSAHALRSYVKNAVRWRPGYWGAKCEGRECGKTHWVRPPTLLTRKWIRKEKRNRPVLRFGDYRAVRKGASMSSMSRWIMCNPSTLEWSKNPYLIEAEEVEEE